MPRARRVAVVGAGAAGLVAARELLREGLDVIVFERSGRVGGTWAYDPRADPDPLAAAGAAHSSLYASLRTNLPRELMGFSGFPLAGRVFAGDARTFPGHREVLAFLDAFAGESGVARRVRLRAEVLRVGPLGRGEEWSVSWRGEAGEVAEEVFDAIVVCNGHGTVPLVPEIQGIDNWRGKQIHSHNYRVPEPFQGQVVVIVGLGASGVDITREISHVAKEVHIAARYSEDRLGKVEPYKNVWMHAEIASKKMDSCVSVKAQQWLQIPFFTVQGTATTSRSWTWMGSPSMTTASGLCTSTSSPQDTRPISPSSGCQSSPSSSRCSSWRPSGWPACCRGRRRCRARRAWRRRCRSTTGGWRRAGGPSATRTYSCPHGWSTWTGWRSRSASRGWRHGGATCTRGLAGASGLWTMDTEIGGRRRKNRTVALLLLRMLGK